MKRLLSIFGALAIAALWSGCVTERQRAAEVKQMEQVDLASSSPSNGSASPTNGAGGSRSPASVPSPAPTSEQVAQLHAVGLNDAAIAQLAAGGQLGNVTTQITQMKAAGLSDAAIANLTAQGVTTGAAFGSAGATTTMNAPTVTMSSAPTASGPSTPPGFGGGGNLGGFGAFKNGNYGGGGGGGGGGGSRPKAPRTENLTATVDLWKTSAPPDDSFAGYTYVLLAHEDGGASQAAIRERNLKLLRVALGRNQAVAEFDRLGTPHEQLNVILIPMKNAVPNGNHDEAFFAAVLDNYDWAFAELMRTVLEFKGQRGPFLYSLLEPWNPKVKEEKVDRLKQDLSDEPDAMVVVWWGVFLQRSSQKDFLQKNKMQSVALSLRNMIEKAAEQAGQSEAALKSVMAIIGLPAGGKE